MPIALGSRLPTLESLGDPDRGGAAVKEEDRNPSPSCSASSSIGNNSDFDLSDEVQSSYKGSLNDLEEALPMRRGISRFYNGKSKSFTSLAEAPCIKELAKPENAYTRKRKNLLHIWGGISKRPLRPSRSTLSLAVAMRSSDSTDSTSSSKLSPWRSFSVADLQQCSNVYGGQGYALFKYNGH